MTEEGQVRPAHLVQQDGVPELLRAAAKGDGGAWLLEKLTEDLAVLGMCGRYELHGVKLKPGAANASGEHMCRLVDSIAAEAGSSRANWSLGIEHVKTAVAVIKGQGNPATASQRLEASKRAANEHFARITASSSWSSGTAREYMTKVDSLELRTASSSGSDGLNLLLVLLGAAIMSGADQAPVAQTEDREEEQRRRECQDARSYEIYMPDDKDSAFDGYMRGKSHGCSMFR